MPKSIRMNQKEKAAWATAFEIRFNNGKTGSQEQQMPPRNAKPRFAETGFI
jgi:hypothetical protein